MNSTFLNHGADRSTALRYFSCLRTLRLETTNAHSGDARTKMRSTLITSHWAAAAARTPSTVSIRSIRPAIVPSVPLSTGLEPAIARKSSS
jgi:hypothetical protein